jgi:hypothetical protein
MVFFPPQELGQCHDMVLTYVMVSVFSPVIATADIGHWLIHSNLA